MNMFGKFLDCYMPTDLEGHPSATYQIDVSHGMTEFVIDGIKAFFDSVKVVEVTNGQSVQSMYESFPDLVKQAREIHQKRTLANNLDRVAHQIRQTHRFKHHLPSAEIAKLKKAETLIESVRTTTDKWNLVNDE